MYINLKIILILIKRTFKMYIIYIIIKLILSKLNLMSDKSRALKFAMDLYESNALFPFINLENEPNNLEYLTQAIRTLTEGLKKMDELEEKYGSSTELIESKEKLNKHLENVKTKIIEVAGEEELERILKDDEDDTAGFFKKYLKYKSKYLALRARL